jgi:hypothetical protein
MSSNAASPSFDWSKFSLGSRIAGGGAIVLLIASFMSWRHISAGPVSASQSGWSAYTLGKLAALVALLAIIVLVLEVMRPDVALPVAPSLALAGLGAIGIFCTLWRIAFVGDPDLEGIDVSPSFGVFLALAGAIALLYGGYRRMQEP